MLPSSINGFVEYAAGAPDDLDEYNKSSDERDGKVIYQFPLHADPKRNIAAGAHGAIGDIESGFSQADTVIEHNLRDLTDTMHTA